MRKEELLLTEALFCALSEKKPDLHAQPELFAPENDSIWANAWEAAYRHGVTAMLENTVKQLADAPAVFRSQVENALKDSGEKCWRMISVCGMVSQLLQKANISHVILKGLGLCALYPQPEMRRPGDLDIWITNKNSFSEAERILNENGFEKCISHSAHHEIFRIRIGQYSCNLELHRFPVASMRNKHIDTELEKIFNALNIDEQIEEQDLLGFRFPVLTPTENAFFLAVHLLQHWRASGISLRMLCDWAVFWKNKESKIDKDKYIELLRKIGIENFSSAISACTSNYLGYPKNATSELPTEILNDFWDDIITGSEFGRQDKDRMLILEDNGIRGIISAFHKETRLSFPRLSRCPLLWPFLYIIELVRFLQNNHSLRHTTTRNVIIQARKRGQIAKQLNLFK